MTATQYFTTPKLQVQKADWQTAVVKTAKEVLVKDLLKGSVPAAAPVKKEPTEEELLAAEAEAFMEGY